MFIPANIAIFFKDSILLNYYLCARLDKSYFSMATFRERALNEASSHNTGRYYVEEGPVSGYFGQNVLDLDKMRGYMSQKAYEAVLASVQYGAKLDRSVSDEIAAVKYQNVLIENVNGINEIFGK